MSQAWSNAASKMDLFSELVTYSGDVLRWLSKFEGWFNKEQVISKDAVCL